MKGTDSTCCCSRGTTLMPNMLAGSGAYCVYASRVAVRCPGGGWGTCRTVAVASCKRTGRRFVASRAPPDSLRKQHHPHQDRGRPLYSSVEWLISSQYIRPKFRLSRVGVQLGYENHSDEITLLTTHFEGTRSTPPTYMLHTHLLPHGGPFGVLQGGVVVIRHGRRLLHRHPLLLVRRSACCLHNVLLPAFLPALPAWQQARLAHHAVEGAGQGRIPPHAPRL